MFEVAWFETGTVKYVINICSVPCKHCSVVPFLFYSLPEMGKLGKLQKSRKNKKLKNVDAEYSNEPRGSKK